MTSAGPAGALGGKVVAVTGADEALGRGLALALAGAGARIAALGDPAVLAATVADIEARDARAVAVSADLSVKASVEAALGIAADELGAPIGVVLHAAVPAIAYVPVAFDAVDDDRWHAVWEGTMRATLFLLQAGFGQMRGRGGRFVFVTPTVSLSGASRLAAYTAAVEGQRLLAKSAARQWGAEGITVNCLAPAAEHVPIGVASTEMSLAAPALGGPGDPERDLGAVAVFLASDAAHFLTGLTLCADGGIWMAP